MKALIACILTLCLVACQDPGQAAKEDHDHSHSHGHAHTPPHGGTPVILGDEQFHLEFLVNAETGVLTAYVLDAHMEKFVRIAAPDIAFAATSAETNQTLSLRAVANSATGETVGETSQFEAQADWLKTAKEFNAVIPSLSIRGRSFTNVAFRFPK